jgi:hypothetical protein
MHSPIRYVRHDHLVDEKDELEEVDDDGDGDGWKRIGPPPPPL